MLQSLIRVTRLSVVLACAMVLIGNDEAVASRATLVLAVVALVTIELGYWTDGPGPAGRLYC